MHTSDKNRQILSMLQDISQVSESLNIKTYIGGGMTIDIWEGQFLRVHDDADGFTDNLIAEKGGRLAAFFRGISFKPSPWGEGAERMRGG